LGGEGIAFPHHVGNEEAVIVCGIEPDYADEQENRAGQGIEEEFDRGIDFPWPAPDAD